MPKMSLESKVMQYWLPLHYTKKDRGHSIEFDLYIPFMYEKPIDYGTEKMSKGECAIIGYDPLFVILNGEMNIKQLVRRRIERKDPTIELYDALCEKFNIIPYNAMENTDGLTVCGKSSIYKEYDSGNSENQLTLEKDKRLKQKVTRYCLECDEEIKTYRSQIKIGKGLFCSVKHSNLHRHEDRFKNVCKYCEVTYESIIPEDFCSDECERFYNEDKDKDPLTLGSDGRELIDGPIAVSWTKSNLINFNENIPDSKPNYGYTYYFINPYTNKEMSIDFSGRDMDIINFSRSPIIYCFKNGSAYPYLWYLNT